MDSMGKLAILFTLAIQRSFPVFSQHCKGPKWQGLPEQEINLLQPGAMVVLCLVFFYSEDFWKLLWLWGELDSIGSEIDQAC